MTIQRYFMRVRGGELEPVEHATGNWVEYEDHLAAVKALEADIFALNDALSYAEFTLDDPGIKGMC